MSSILMIRKLFVTPTGDYFFRSNLLRDLPFVGVCADYLGIRGQVVTNEHIAVIDYG